MIIMFVNLTVRVDAVVYYRVLDPVKVVVDVQNYQHAIGQVAQASLRSIIGKSLLDDLLCDRERLNQGLELMIDSPAAEWGVHIDRFMDSGSATSLISTRSMCTPQPTAGLSIISSRPWLSRSRLESRSSRSLFPMIDRSEAWATCPMACA